MSVSGGARRDRSRVRGARGLARDAARRTVRGRSTRTRDRSGLRRPAPRPRVRRARADAPDPGSKECEQVGSERAGVGRLGPGGVPLVVERVEGERLLARPPAVDRGLAHAGAFGDLVHAHRLETLLEQQLRGGVEDRRVRLLAAGPASPLLLTRRRTSLIRAGTFRERLVERCDVAPRVAEPLGLRERPVGGAG